MAEKILIIDDDLDTLRLVGLMLQRQGYDILAASNGQQGLEKANSEIPDVILLDVMMPGMDGYEVAKQLRANPDTAAIPILMFTAKSQLDDKVTGFEAGADDYLTKPTHPAELQAHVKALLSRAIIVEDSEQEAATEAEHAHLVGVLSARGGLGVSSLTLNLSSSLEQKSGDTVIAVEMTPGSGTIGRDMGVHNLQGLVELLTLKANQLSEKKVQENLISHKTGVQLLLASDKPRDIQIADNAQSQYEMLLSRLAALARFVVLDFGAGLSRSSQNSLTRCDQIIIIVEGLENSILHTRALLDDVLELGIDKSKIVIVMNNRVRSEMLLARNQVQEKLGHAISLSITPAPELFTQSTRIHVPAILHQPESLTAQQFAKLADIIMEKEAEQE